MNFVVQGTNIVLVQNVTGVKRPPNQLRRFEYRHQVQAMIVERPNPRQPGPLLVLNKVT